MSYLHRVLCPLAFLTISVLLLSGGLDAPPVSGQTGQPNIIQGPFVMAGRSHEPARIEAASQGGLAMLAIVYSPLRAHTKVVS